MRTYGGYSEHIVCSDRFVFCGEHDIVSDIERIPIQSVNEAYERMQASDVRYRFVIELDSLRAATD